MKTADDILKKHLILKLEAGKTSDDDRVEAIWAAMEEYAKKFEEDYYKAIRENAIYISLLKQAAKRLSPLHDSKLLKEIKERIEADTL